MNDERDTAFTYTMGGKTADALLSFPTSDRSLELPTSQPANQTTCNCVKILEQKV